MEVICVLEQIFEIPSKIKTFTKFIGDSEIVLFQKHFFFED